MDLIETHQAADELILNTRPPLPLIIDPLVSAHTERNHLTCETKLICEISLLDRTNAKIAGVVRAESFEAVLSHLEAFLPKLQQKLNSPAADADDYDFLYNAEVLTALCQQADDNINLPQMYVIATKITKEFNLSFPVLHIVHGCLFTSEDDDNDEVEVAHEVELQEESTGETLASAASDSPRKSLIYFALELISLYPLPEEGFTNLGKMLHVEPQKLKDSIKAPEGFKMVIP